MNGRRDVAERVLAVEVRAVVARRELVVERGCEHDDLGARGDPVETLEHETGLRALQLLLATLAMTPLRRLSGRPEPIQLRRTLCLFAYFYMCVHFSMYLVFDLELSLPKLGEDLAKRTYITLGFSCWLLLLPLAVTSTDRRQRRLRRAWKRLHRLIYPAALLACTSSGW